MRATQADALNDPFELKPFFSQLVSRDELESRLQDEAIVADAARAAYADLPPAFKQSVSQSAFLALLRTPKARAMLQTLLKRETDELITRHMPDLTEKTRALLHRKLGALVGIVSFSDSIDETLMWSHYAVDHKGYALGFDEVHPFFDRRRTCSDEFFHLRPVRYYDGPLSGASLSDLDGAAVLCAKQGIWKYEYERRLLIPLEDDESPEAATRIHLIVFPKETVREVVFGHRASKELIEEIEEMTHAAQGYGAVTYKRATADLESGRIVIQSHS